LLGSKYQVAWLKMLEIIFQILGYQIFFINYNTGVMTC
jgi:hypothetical protein